MGAFTEMSASGFDEQYQGSPPWDTRRPQKAFVDFLSQHPPQSPVLDIGCGSGDLAVYVARLGCDVLGVDFSPTAIEKARSKAAGTQATFEVQDVFSWSGPEQRFKTVLDCCFYHVLSDTSRVQYEQFLRRVLEPGGEVHMLCCAGGFGIGPRIIKKSDIDETFGAGWSIISLEDTVVELSFAPPGTGMPGMFVRLKLNLT